MGLKIMKADGGGARPMWYARFTRHGAKVNVNLGVPIRGTVPVDADGRFDADGEGDAAFRKSREAALAAFAKMRAAAKTTGDAPAVKAAKTADLARRFYRAREGKSIEAADTRLADLPKLWRARPRSYTPTPARMDYYDSVFARFAKFAGEYATARGGTCDTLNTVTGEIATAYFNALRAEYAWETVKGVMSLLSGAFDTWATSGDPNPFRAIVKRNREIGAAKVHKRPLSEAELVRLFDVAADNDLLRPLIDCAACTGMRIGDVCNLKWCEPIKDPDGNVIGRTKTVDLEAGFIDVTTAKAGTRVTIPIFPRLRRTLEERAADVDAQGGEYVFPRAAAIYNHTNARGKPDRRMMLIRAVKPLFALAVYGDKPEVEDAANAEPMASGEIRAAIEGARFAPAKKARVLDTYSRYAGGATYAEITAATGRGKAVVSQDLRTVEDLIGRRIRPGDAGASRSKGGVSKRELIRRTRAARGVGKFSASLYGWHSLRTSFVTIALQYGVPLEDVRKIVGHATSRTTEDYNRAGKQHAAERVKRQLAGSAFDAPALAAKGAAVDVPTDGNALAPARDPAADARALALARAVLGADEAARVDAVIRAAGVDADKAPARALALALATVDAGTQEKIAAVIRAAQ